jgi:hypothetical protein
MSGRLSSFRSLCLPVLFALGIAMGGTLNAADGGSPAGRQIEISTPKAATLITNLNQLSTDTQTEPAPATDFSTPQFFSPGASSLSGVMPLPPPSRGVTLPTRHTRELMDERRNWAFQTPEDLVREIAMRDILNLPTSEPEGDETRPATTMERFYERTWGMHNERNGTATGQNDYFLSSQKAEPDKKNFSPLRNGKPFSSLLDQRLLSLKSVQSLDSNTQLSDSDAGTSQLLDAFGVRANDDRDDDLSPQKIAEKTREKQQFSQYQDLLNGITPVESSLSGKSSPAVNPWSVGGTALTPATTLLNPFAALPGSTVNPALLPPTTPQSPVPSSLAPVPFATLPERTPPPRPNFSFPQRAF